MLPLSFWIRLDGFWPHFGTIATCTNPMAQETNVTDLCHTFFRNHQIDFYNFWIWSQDVWTMLPLRIWTRLDEFSLLYIVFELSDSLFWNQNDTLSFPRTISRLDRFGCQYPLTGHTTSLLVLKLLQKERTMSSGRFGLLRTPKTRFWTEICNQRGHAYR